MNLGEQAPLALEEQPECYAVTWTCCDAECTEYYRREINAKQAQRDLLDQGYMDATVAPVEKLFKD